MEKTWKPMAAGILILIAVLLSIVCPIIYLFGDFNGLAALGVFIIYIPAFIVIGIPVCIGGILALRRSSWVVVVICSILACILYLLSGFLAAEILYPISAPFDGFAPLFGILFFLVGAIATALIFLSREEFE